MCVFTEQDTGAICPIPVMIIDPDVDSFKTDECCPDTDTSQRVRYIDLNGLASYLVI